MRYKSKISLITNSKLGWLDEMATSGGETLLIFRIKVVKLYLLHTKVVVAMDGMAGWDCSMVVVKLYLLDSRSAQLTIANFMHALC